MTRFYSELTEHISQKRRKQIEKRKEEIRARVFSPAIALRNALQDLALGHVRPIEDVLREAQEELCDPPHKRTRLLPR